MMIRFAAHLIKAKAPLAVVRYILATEQVTVI